MICNLDLETPRPSATTGTLEFSSLGFDIWLLVLVWSETKVPDTLSRVLWPSQKQSVGACWGTEGQLVESDGFTTSGNDPGARSGGESESGYGDLWNVIETGVIGDGADDDDGLIGRLGVFVGDLFGDAGEGDGRSVDFRHEESAEDDLVEVGVGSASEEPVKLDEEGQVWVITLGSLSVARPQVVCLQIDTHGDCCG